MTTRILAPQQDARAGQGRASALPAANLGSFPEGPPQGFTESRRGTP